MKPIFVPRSFYYSQATADRVRSVLYGRGVFRLGSWLTMLVALVWLIERAFNLKLMSA